MPLVSLSYSLTLLLTGLSAGLGFANAIGYIPAFKRMSPEHTLAFWQNADYYFRARMPVFGIALSCLFYQEFL